VGDPRPADELEAGGLGALLPDPGNANRGTERGAAMLEDSLRRYGAGRSVVVDRRGVLIGGNKTAAAALAAGLTRTRVIQTAGDELVVVQRTDLDLEADPRAQELAIADNRVQQVSLEWDPAALERLAVSGADLERFWSTSELAALLEPTRARGSDPGADVARAGELRRKWATARGQLWTLGPHRVVCGDATVPEDVAKLHGGAVPALILTDPPYCSGGFQEAGRSRGSVGTDAEILKPVHNDTLSTRGYQALLKSVLAHAQASAAYIFTDWRMWVSLFDVVESSGYGVRNMLVWDKGSPGMGVGWRAQHELVLFGSRVPLTWRQPGHEGVDPQRAAGNVLEVGRSGNVHHTVEKPVELLRQILRVTDFLETVYDPFLGSGSTLIAGAQEGRAVFGMELDPEYVAVTLERAAGLGLEPVLVA
jgi:DNA modification methylase